VLVERLIDRDDRRLRDFVHLRDVQLRTSKEEAEGLFLCEGEATIRRALTAGYAPRAVLCTERWLAAFDDLPNDVRALVVDDELLTETVGFRVHRGALASFARRPLPKVSGVVAGARRVAVLEDVGDHTNVGSIFRSVAAMGADAVVLTPRCADPLYRRAVRTSMGAVFAVPWARIDWRSGPRVLRDAGFTLVALTPAADAIPLTDVDVPALDRAAILLGAEGPGLSERWTAAADVRVRIPMRAGVDSLNVAAAAAVALYALGATRPAAGPA
jgi:tRNA G18 (ribose-2'-O)-methylase SpoU